MKNDRNLDYVLLVFFVIPLIWLAILVAPYMDKGLIGALPYFGNVLNHPFSFRWCDYTVRTVLIFLLVYCMGIIIYCSTRKNYRRQEEYGSARWANPKAINKKYADKDIQHNKILSQNVSIGLNGKKHRRNLNTLVIGGSGAGKTRFYGKPNIMQCNTSYVILDPKGEILRDTGKLLEQEGYIIKVIDLINMNHSHGYNPFAYIHDDKDVLKLITNLIRNTTPKGSQSTDPFWEKSETALLEALCLYLLNEAPEDEQNFSMVMEMIVAAEPKEDDEDYMSPLDYLFYDWYYVKISDNLNMRIHHCLCVSFC